MAWRQCPKRLWLEVRRPELAVYPSATRRSFAMGHEVGAVARTLQAGGVLIDPPTLGAGAARHGASARPPAATSPCSRPPSATAACSCAPTCCGARPAWRTWSRSSRPPTVRRHHVDDAAVQAWVVRGAGVPLERVALACIDREFVYGGDGDYRGLLRETDVSARVDALVPPYPRLDRRLRRHARRRPARSRGLRGVLAGPSPAPSPRPARRGRARAMPPPQRPIADRRRASPACRSRASTWASRPSRCAVPVWAGTRPWEALPFQWSCHVEQAAGELEHREFLDTSGDAPMRAFAETLVATLGADGPGPGLRRRRARASSPLSPRATPTCASSSRRSARASPICCPIAPVGLGRPRRRQPWSLDDLLPTVAPELDARRSGRGARRRRPADRLRRGGPSRHLARARRRARPQPARLTAPGARSASSGCAGSSPATTARHSPSRTARSVS